MSALSVILFIYFTCMNILLIYMPSDERFIYKLYFRLRFQILVIVFFLLYKNKVFLLPTLKMFRCYLKVLIFILTNCYFSLSFMFFNLSNLLHPIYLFSMMTVFRVYTINSRKNSSILNFGGGFWYKIGSS